MSSNKQYSETFKDDAVRYFHESGQSITQVANNLGIAKTTLSGWIKQRKPVNAAPKSDSDLYKRIATLEK